MSDHIHDENCDHEHDDEIIEIEDENGVVREMILALTFEARENTYAVLVDRQDPEADAMIFRLDEQDDELLLADIESDEEWQFVLSVYETLANEQA
jgi:uncharacterized protein YrzB (UPF0473 family)